MSKTESLSNQAYEYVLKRIINFDYQPGDAIVENDVCTELNISRTPLREALRRLEAEGFVTKNLNHSTFVRAYTQDDIIENCVIRTLFETYALRNCIEMVEDSEINAIRELLLQIDDKSTQDDYYNSDTALHGMITKYCMNFKMTSILQSLAVQLNSIQRISAKTPNRLIKSREEHLELLCAIEDRDLERSQALLTAHLENVKQSCLNAFRLMRLEKSAK